MDGPSVKGDNVPPNTSPPPYTPTAEDPVPFKRHLQQPLPPGFVPPTAAIHTHQHVVVAQAMHFDSESQMVHCAHCGHRGMTEIRAKPNTFTHTVALILCCFVCWPCAWLPYVCDSCQSIHHYCSHCNAYLGEYRGS